MSLILMSVLQSIVALLAVVEGNSFPPPPGKYRNKDTLVDLPLSRTRKEFDKLLSKNPVVKRTRQKGKFNHRLTPLGTRRFPGEMITSGRIVGEMEALVRGLAESRSPATSELEVHPRRL